MIKIAYISLFFMLLISCNSSYQRKQLDEAKGSIRTYYNSENYIDEQIANLSRYVENKLPLNKEYYKADDKEEIMHALSLIQKASGKDGTDFENLDLDKTEELIRLHKGLARTNIQNAKLLAQLYGSVGDSIIQAIKSIFYFIIVILVFAFIWKKLKIFWLKWKG